MRLFVHGAKAAKTAVASAMPMAPRRIATHDGTFHCTCRTLLRSDDEWNEQLTRQSGVRNPDPRRRSVGMLLASQDQELLRRGHITQ